MRYINLILYISSIFAITELIFFYLQIIIKGNINFFHGLEYLEEILIRF